MFFFVCLFVCLFVLEKTLTSLNKIKVTWINITFLGLEIRGCVDCQLRDRKHSDFITKINLCSKDEPTFYGFGMI